MRVKLGELRFNSHDSVLAARRKVYRLLTALQAGEVFATRISSVVSQVCKQNHKSGSDFSVVIEFASDISGFIELNFIFSDRIPLSEESILVAFFHHVRPSELLNERYQQTASLRLPPMESGLSSESISYFQSIVGEKSREELMAEISLTNEELRDSLENLKRTRSAKERMESELNIGRDIQMSMLPLEFPPFPDRHELDIYALLHPAREVGGDFYDFFFVDRNHFCFCIGDVSGKGVPSSLFMAVTKTLIKSNASDDISTAGIITQVNTELATENKSSMFVTLFICLLNVETGKMVYTNAGHNPPYIVRRNGTQERLDTLHGPVLGAVDGIAYKEGEARLYPSDTVIMYTDGVSEAMNESEELYSEARLVDILASSKWSDMNTAVTAILENVKSFEDGATQADDITILGMQYLGSKNSGHVEQILLKSHLAEITKVFERIKALEQKGLIKEPMTRQLSVVLDELLNNSISYAFDDEEEHEITVEIQIGDEDVTIKIVDDGAPYNPFSSPEPDLSLGVEERAIGGLGVHIVKNIMDDYSYDRHDGKNVVTLVKNHNQDNEGS